MSSPLGSLQSAERPALPRRELARMARDAKHRFGLVLIDLALIADEKDRALVSRIARLQLEAMSR